MKTTRSAALRAKPISWVTTIMVMPSLARPHHDVQHLVDHLRVERRGRLVEEHHLGLHRQRAGDRDALLLAAGQLRRVACRPGWPRPPGPAAPWPLLGLGRLDALATLIGPERDVLQDRLVGEEVERLEHHADVGAQLGQRLALVGQRLAVDA